MARRGLTRCGNVAGAGQGRWPEVTFASRSGKNLFWVKAPFFQNSHYPFRGMDRKSRTRYRKILAGMLKQLDVEASTTVNGMRGEATPFPDPTDRAALESDRNLTLRIRDRERKLRNKINEALARIKEGTFGICEVCEEEISEERLRARPVTTLCIHCKETQEEDEERHHVG